MSARILIVDDIPANLRVLEARLSAEFYDVALAASGAEAIAAARSRPPDLILLDVMMPVMDGFETCRRLKADPATAHIPVVMVTALTEVQDRVRGLQAGADDFVSKPPNPVALLARIRSLLRVKMLGDEWRQRRATSERLGLAGEPAGPGLESAGRGRLLLFEPDAAAADQVAELLAADGHAIERAADPAAALARLAEGGLDLALVSLAAGADPGLRLCAAIRSAEATRHLPILALLDAEAAAHVARALDLGVSDYITRPFDAHELVARTRTQIRNWRYHERLRAMHRRNLELALVDSLTGVHNRRYADAHLEALAARAVAAGRAIAVLMVDIDRFKAINDSRGHRAGDAVLKAVADRLLRQLRAYDTLARWGGEEFLVVLPEAEADTAAAVAERLRAAVAESPVDVPGGPPLAVTASVGVATSRPGADAPEDLVAAADAALYAAKRAGRDRVAVAPEPAALAS